MNYWLTPGNMTMEPQPGFGLSGQEAAPQYSQNWAGLSVNPEDNSYIQSPLGYFDPMTDPTNTNPGQAFESPGTLTQYGQFSPEMTDRPTMVDTRLMMPEPSGGSIGAPSYHIPGPQDPNFQGLNDRPFIRSQPQQQNFGSTGIEGDVPQLMGEAQFDINQFIDLTGGDEGGGEAELTDPPPKQSDFGMQKLNIEE